MGMVLGSVLATAAFAATGYGFSLLDHLSALHPYWLAQESADELLIHLRVPQRV